MTPKRFEELRERRHLRSDQVAQIVEGLPDGEPVDQLARIAIGGIDDGWEFIAEIESLQAQLADKDAEIERLKQWVNDLQSGMYINCVYCGHRYGPKDEIPTSMAQVLKDHIEQCPQHPMSHLKNQLAEKDAEIERLKAKEGR